MLLTDEQIAEICVDISLDTSCDIAFARAIESAVLEKLKAQEPFAYFSINDYGAWEETSDPTARALYEHPDPRVAELEAVLRECRDVIEEAQTYCEGPQWSPSMAHDCGTAIAKIDEVLPK